MKVVNKVLIVINSFLVSILISFTYYLKTNFVDMPFEQLLYTIFNSEKTGIVP